MRILLPAVFLVGCEVAAPTPQALATPEDPFDPELAGRLQEALDTARREIEAPGATLAVTLPGEGTWVGGSGAAIKGGDPISPEERQRIGSVTKTFVAAVVLQLDEEGVWTLDDPVGDWVPGLPAWAGAIPLRHLLNHTSGLVDTADQLELVAHFSEYWTPAEIVAASLEDDALFAPGTGYSYANTNYMVLGLAIESATANTLAAEIRGRLLDPLGLDDTFLEGDETIEGTMANGYIGGNDVTDAMNPVWSWAAGNMVSDADDLSRWFSALLGGEVLSKRALRQMRTPSELASGRLVDYGLGLQLRERGGDEAIGHTGSTMGFQADVFCRRDGETCVVALCNDFLSDATTIARAAWDELPQ